MPLYNPAGGAPVDAEYLTGVANTTLTAERVLTDNTDSWYFLARVHTITTQGN